MEPCWRYFAYLGALGPLLRVSWLLVGVLDRFCCVWERFGLDFGRFGSLLGGFLDPPTFIFPVLWPHARALVAQTPDMEKPRKNLGFFDVLRT